jgi:hypothetical protein
MAADDAIAAGPAFVDVAPVVDQRVVPDVAPAAGDGVVVVDRADRHQRILEVCRIGVVDDRVGDGRVLRCPDLPAVLEAETLVGAPGSAVDIARIARDRGRRCLLSRVHRTRSGRDVDDFPGKPAERRRRTVGIERAVADEGGVAGDDQRPVAAAVLAGAAAVAVFTDDHRLAPTLPVGARGHLDRRPGPFLAAPVGGDGGGGPGGREDDGLRRRITDHFGRRSPDLLRLDPAAGAGQSRVALGAGRRRPEQAQADQPGDNPAPAHRSAGETSRRGSGNERGRAIGVRHVAHPQDRGEGATGSARDEKRRVRTRGIPMERYQSGAEVSNARRWNGPGRLQEPAQPKPVSSRRSGGDWTGPSRATLGPWHPLVPVPLLRTPSSPFA